MESGADEKRVEEEEVVKIYQMYLLFQRSKGKIKDDVGGDARGTGRKIQHCQKTEREQEK